MRAPAVHEMGTNVCRAPKKSTKLSPSNCSQEMVKNLAGGIAHQFNNALVGIIGSIELLRLDLCDQEKTDRHIDRIESSVTRMTNLTNQLLAYAQGGKYHPRRVSVNQLIDETLLQIKTKLNGNITIETDLQESLERIMADENQLKMVISAIINNAAEAINEGGRIRITTESEQIFGGNSGKEKKALIHMIVEDNGPGMSEPVRQRVFEPFFSTKMKGRGLGMAAVHGIILNHDGWITVDSDEDIGTKVHIILPGISEDCKVREKGSGRRDFPPTVLVVDDEEVVVDVLLAFLKRLDYRILTARTGQEAIDLAAEYNNAIDLALLDIELPDMSGHIVYQHLIETCPNIKVIVCSGYSVGGPVREVLESGAQAFIQKPFSYSTFSQILDKIMKESRPAMIPA